jgi:hypothetical protein
LKGFFMRFCKNCKESFVPNGRQVHCSVKCRNEYWKRIEKENLQREANEIRKNFIGNCKYCKCYFTIDPIKGVQKSFCSTKCKDEFHKAKKREANDLKHDLCDKKCDHCDKMFKPRRHINERFCSKQCHTDYHANQDKIKRAEIRANTIRECPICNISFTPKKSLKEMHCSTKCRLSLGKKIYKMMSSVYDKCGTAKETNSHKILGYSAEELLNRLRTFPQWDRLKLGTWHLDHIFPIKAFVDKKISDASLICAIDNLQPLSGTTNCKKNGKYNELKFNQWLISKGVVDV